MENKFEFELQQKLKHTKSKGCVDFYLSNNSKYFLVYFTGKLTDCHNNSYQYHKDVEHQNTGGVIAAYSNHQFYIERVPESIREKLPTQVHSE